MGHPGHSLQRHPDDLVGSLAGGAGDKADAAGVMLPVGRGSSGVACEHIRTGAVRLSGHRGSPQVVKQKGPLPQGAGRSLICARARVSVRDRSQAGGPWR